MKYILAILLCVLIGFNTYSQCNTSQLLRRPYEKYKNADEKTLNIQLTVKNDKGIIHEVNLGITTLKTYIKECLNKPEKPKIDKYIAELYFTKKLFSTYRIKETENLDKLVYCFIIFLEDKYSKIKTAISSSEHVKDVATKIDAIYDEIESEGLPKLMDIDKEMVAIGTKYGVQ